MVTALALTKELMLGMWSGEQCFTVAAALQPYGPQFRRT